MEGAVGLSLGKVVALVLLSGTSGGLGFTAEDAEGCVTLPRGVDLAGSGGGISPKGEGAVREGALSGCCLLLGGTGGGCLVFASG